VDGASEFGEYVVHEQLGAGGMATVHRAELRGVAGFRRAVALKRLLPSAAAQPDLVQAFIEEARLASKLTHANIAQTYDLGKVGSTYFIAMEYVAGPTLMQVIRQCISAAGPMPMAIAIHVLTEIADALNYAHNVTDPVTGAAMGVIHRDVSPSNIMISNAGIVKLIDFGIAKAASSDMRTAAGVIKGKFGYIAPEYISGGRIDARADLFGFGVIAHELLTTRMLFQHDDDFESLRRVREMPVQPPSKWNREVGTDLDDIVLTALQRDPDRRWQTASALRTALTNLSRTVAEPVTGQYVAHWLEWAFSQKPRDPGELSAVIESLGGEPSRLVEVRLTPAAELDREPEIIRVATPVAGVPAAILPGSFADQSAAVTILGKRPSAEPPPTDKFPAAPRRTRVVLLLVLLLAVAGAAYAWHFRLLPAPFPLGR
jgi:serine/threonine protein kinase